MNSRHAAGAILVTFWASAALSAPFWSSPLLPDPQLTPGDVMAVTAADVCAPGYAKKIRNVPLAVKKQVFAEYGIPWFQRRLYEVDHYISLELGGSNSIRNLWPEPLHVAVNGLDEGAKTKDALEDHLHALVCSGRLSLAEAQRVIRGNWVTAYPQYLGAFPPYRQGKPGRPAN